MGEITRFTGSGSEQYTTDHFTCDHVEWRIRWEYVPHSEYPSLTMFSMLIYEEGEDILFDQIVKSGGDNTSGTSYIHNKSGTFYSEINVANTEGYTIIIEQDLDSIPEFSSSVIPLLFMITTLVTATAYRRKHTR